MFWHSKGLPLHPGHNPPSCPHPEGQPCSTASLGAVFTCRKHFHPTSPCPAHNTHWRCSLPMAGAGGREGSKSSSEKTLNLLVTGFKFFFLPPIQIFHWCELQHPAQVREIDKLGLEVSILHPAVGGSCPGSQ